MIEYTANENYWDAEHVYIPKVKLVYYNGSDPDSLFNGFDKGEYSAAPVYTDNAAIYKTAKEKYGDAIYISRTTSMTFWISWIFDRNIIMHQEMKLKMCHHKRINKKQILV